MNTPTILKKIIDRKHEEVRERVEAVVKQRMSPQLRQKFVEHFGSPPLG